MTRNKIEANPAQPPSRSQSQPASMQIIPHKSVLCKGHNFEVVQHTFLDDCWLEIESFCFAEGRVALDLSLAEELAGLVQRFVRFCYYVPQL